jgi:hypothetical protein
VREKRAGGKTLSPLLFRNRKKSLTDLDGAHGTHSFSKAGLWVTSQGKKVKTGRNSMVGKSSLYVFGRLLLCF